MNRMTTKNLTAAWRLGLEVEVGAAKLAFRK
jgi:hypothetical protein